MLRMIMICGLLQKEDAASEKSKGPREVAMVHVGSAFQNPSSNPIGQHNSSGASEVILWQVTLL